MQNARILAARIVVIVTQDSLVTGKVAKVSGNGSVINEFTKTKESLSCPISAKTVVSKLEFSVLMNIMNMGIVNGERSVNKYINK